MQTVDEEFLAAAKDFITKANKSQKPFFVWFNTTHMHFRTHAKPRSRGQSGRWQSEYHDVMIDHDKHVGELLNLLDDWDCGNTFVMYSTDNGPHMNSWPDAGMTPFRNEKNSNWEGAYRVRPWCAGRERSKPGSVSNGSFRISTGCQRFSRWPAIPISRRNSRRATALGDKTFKVHLDGYNLLPYLTGQEKKSPRIEYFYFSDDGDLTAFRYDNWKIVFMEQRVTGTMRIWAEPFVPLRVPKIFNLRTDPYESADITSNTYYDWLLEHAYLLCRHSKLSGNSWQLSKNSRRGRRQQVSRSIRSWRSSPSRRTVWDENFGRELRQRNKLWAIPRS